MPSDLFGPVHRGRSTGKVAKGSVLLLAQPLAGWASKVECLRDPKASKLWPRGNLWQRLNRLVAGQRPQPGQRPRPLLAPVGHWDLASSTLSLRSFGPRSGLFPAIESLSEGENCTLQLLKDTVAASEMHLKVSVLSLRWSPSRTWRISKSLGSKMAAFSLFHVPAGGATVPLPAALQGRKAFRMCSHC